MNHVEKKVILFGGQKPSLAVKEKYPDDVYDYAINDNKLLEICAKLEKQSDDHYRKVRE